MRRIRRCVTVGCAAVALYALAVGSASALQFKDAVTGTSLAVGASVYGATTTPEQWSGTFFGISGVTIKCDSRFTGTVLANADTAGHPVASIDSYATSNCVGFAGTACTVVADGLPWTPTGAVGGNGGGLIGTSTTTLDRGMGSGDIDLSNCLGGTTCKIQGSTTYGDGVFTLDRAQSLPWTNGASEQLAVGSFNVAATCSVSGFTWSGQYRITDSAGNAVSLA